MLLGMRKGRLSYGLEIPLRQCFPTIADEAMSSLRSKPENRNLSENEKAIKRNRKRAFKWQSKHQTLQNRLQVASQRKDQDLTDKIRLEINEWGKVGDELSAELGFDVKLPERDNNKQLSESDHKARQWIEKVTCQLQREINSQLEDDDCVNSKEAELYRVALLKKHMKKATVEVSQFQDVSALKGYAKEKFFQRAWLVLRSLSKVVPEKGGDSSDSWVERFRNVRTVCSIGAGPGSDAVGFLAFLRFLIFKLVEERKETPGHRMILLDWTMPHWKAAVLDNLCSVLKSNHKTTKVEIEMETCDIRKSLWEDPTHEIVRRMFGLVAGTASESKSHAVDIFILSYLLSETRGKWHAFLDDIVDLSPPGTMFLVLDPTAWQLHLFRSRYLSQMSFEWLDSSRESPHLQSLESRLGPGVLLASRLPKQ